jgi:hypothetical protein
MRCTGLESAAVGPPLSKQKVACSRLEHDTLRWNWWIKTKRISPLLASR